MKRPADGQQRQLIDEPITEGCPQRSISQMAECMRRTQATSTIARRMSRARADDAKMVADSRICVDAGAAE